MALAGSDLQWVFFKAFAHVKVSLAFHNLKSSLKPVLCHHKLS